MRYRGNSIEDAVYDMVFISKKLHQDRLEALSFGYAFGGSSFDHTDNVLQPFMASMNTLTDQLMVDLLSSFIETTEVLKELLQEIAEREAQAFTDGQRPDIVNDKSNSKITPTESTVPEISELNDMLLEAFDNAAQDQGSLPYIVPNASDPT